MTVKLRMLLVMVQVIPACLSRSLFVPILSCSQRHLISRLLATRAAPLAHHPYFVPHYIWLSTRRDSSRGSIARPLTMRRSTGGRSPYITVSPTGFRRDSARRLDDLGDVFAELGHGSCHLLGEDVAEGAKGAHLATHELVAAADELDKLARVNIRVTAIFDVLEELGRDGRELVGRGG